MKRNIDGILNAYLVCALWASIDDNDESLAINYSIDDFSANFLNSAIIDIRHFLSLIKVNNLTESLEQWDDEQIGHDLFLTRNGHGAGFWDRDFKDGDKITELIANDRILNEINLYITVDDEVDSE